MGWQTLRLAVDDGIAILTLDRPARRNAFGDGMGRELAEAYARCDADDDIRVVVLTGAPPAFCAGADLEGGEETFVGTEEGSAPPAYGSRRFGCANPSWPQSMVMPSASA
ncbi:enoyl-CoA hydratase-related protein [Nocardioides alcanivorans]|uniref:enoyl-CoA hydratase-related protein n=1 Tax=Nocardioides alcanivorans TaxID=2897352 RepID=UPI001F1C3D7C|nr:enoyl-CoA hydratase-related protein [Nocardioides alcanivorans]